MENVGKLSVNLMLTGLTNLTSDVYMWTCTIWMTSFAASCHWSGNSEQVFINQVNFQPTSIDKHNSMGHLLPCASRGGGGGWRGYPQNTVVLVSVRSWSKVCPSYGILIMNIWGKNPLLLCVKMGLYLTVWHICHNLWMKSGLPFCSRGIWVWLTHCGLMMPYGDIDLGQH